MDVHKSPISTHDCSGAPVSGNPQTFFGTALVGFIDILGFSHHIKEHWGHDSESPLSKLLRIKNAPLLLNDHERSIITAATPSWVRQTTYTCAIRTVSDSIALLLALPDVKQITTFEFFCAYAQLILTATEIQEIIIDEGFVSRGALDIGPIYWDTENVIGPTLIDCYGMETRCAVSARYIIGPRLLSMIANFSMSTDTYREQAFDLFYKDMDELIAVRPNSINKAKDQELVSRRLRDIKTMKRNAPTPRTSDKYTTLIKAMESHRNYETPTSKDATIAAKKIAKMMQDNNSEYH